MAGLELTVGTDPKQAVKAFETILAELEKVRPLNYRNSLFTRWKQIVQTALTRFLGPDHPHTTAFNAIVFHGPMPKSPMDPPVSDKDKAAYEAGMATTAGVLTSIVLSLNESTVAAPEPLGAAPAPVSLAAAPAPVTSPEPASKLVFKAADTMARFAANAPPPPPAAGQELRSTHDLARHAGPVPEGGIRIVSRSGTSTPTSTLEQLIDATEDSQHKALLMTIKEAVDAPDGTWAAVKNAIAELWWADRDAVQKVLPLILRR